MPTTTAIKNNGVALANPDSKIHVVTNTIGEYYANPDLFMAKIRNTKTIPSMPEQYSNLISFLSLTESNDDCMIHVGPFVVAANFDARGCSNSDQVCAAGGLCEIGPTLSLRICD